MQKNVVVFFFLFTFIYILMYDICTFRHPSPLGILWGQFDKIVYDIHDMVTLYLLNIYLVASYK